MLPTPTSPCAHVDTQLAQDGRGFATFLEHSVRGLLMLGEQQTRLDQSPSIELVQDRYRRQRRHDQETFWDPKQAEGLLPILELGPAANLRVHETTSPQLKVHRVPARRLVDDSERLRKG
jgi:hypothetical protein